MTLTPMLHARAAHTRQRLTDPGLMAGFDPAEPRDPDGKWSRVGALLGRLKKATGDAVQFDDRDYVDWSSPAPHGGREFEFGNRRDSVRLALTADEIDSVHGALTDSLHHNSDDGLVLDDGRELSWQPLDDEGDQWDLSAADADGNQVTFDWPRSRMEHFHHALTGTLLAEAMGQHGGPSARARRRPANFDPEQPRVPGGEHGGEWSGGSVLKDVLKLAGKIELQPDEELLGSNKIDGDLGGVRMALTEQDGRRWLRLGVGPQEYGKRNRDEGIAAWDGNPSHAALPEGDRERLDAEYDALGAEYDSASPARQDEISSRQDDIREQLMAGDEGFNGTAKLDEHSMGQLADQIRPALDEAVKQYKAEQAAWEEINRLEAEGNPDPARMAELRRIGRADSTDYVTFTQGVIPGSAWGDVHYSVEMDDSDPYVTLGVQPKDAPGDWGDDKDWTGQFDPAEARKLLRLLGQYAGPAETGASARTGHRVTAGRLRPTSLFTSTGRSRRLLNRADVKPRPTRTDGQRWYRITNTAAGPTEVMIYDEIGLFGVSAAALVSDLKAITGDQIALHINSPGGEVFDGIAIYNALKNHKAAVTVHIDGLAASAASFIAQAGDTVRIARNAQMMIHDGLAVCVGNAADMQETAKLLDRCSDNIADIYAQRAGGTVADWRARMRAETWYTAQEAVDAGLADEVAQQPARDGDVALVVASWDLSVFRYPGRTAAPGPAVLNAAPGGAMGCDTCDNAASDDQVPDDHYEQMLTDMLADLDDDQVRELAELAEAMLAANPDTPAPAARASAPVNEHIGFNALKARLAAKGAHNPGGLAAYIGRKKYGREGMAAKAAAGRAAHKAARHASDRAAVPLFEFDPDLFRAAVVASRPAEPVFNADLFRAAVQVVATDAPAAPDPTPPAPPEDPEPTIDPAAFRRALREGRL